MSIVNVVLKDVFSCYAIVSFSNMFPHIKIRKALS